MISPVVPHRSQRSLPIVPAPEQASIRRGKLRHWTWAHRTTALAFLFWFALGDWLPWWLFQGNWNAARWFGAVDVVDPLVAAETVLASRSISWELVLGVLPTVGAALVLGRVFCGWVCPLGVVLELGTVVTGRVRRRQPPRQLGRGWKYLLLGATLVGSAVAGMPLFAAISPINAPFVWRGDWLAVALAAVATLLVLELWFPRAFCRSLCPLGAFYSLLGRWALLRVRITGEERIGCLHCTRDCPMGIDVMRDHVLAGHTNVSDPECTRCGSCTDRCLGEILQLGFGPGGERTRKPDPPRVS